MKHVLRVRNLSKSFKKNFWSSPQFILKDLSFSILKGSVTGFLGPNGSGKTTAFKCLFRFLKKDSGEIQFFEQELFTDKMKQRIGFLPEHPQFYQDLTAEELLLFYGKLTQPSCSHSSLKKRVHQLLKEVDVYFFKDQKIKTFSKGMVQKIGVVQAYLSQPEFVVLDEPFSGLDPEGRFYVSSLIKKMHQEGGSVFFSSHSLQDVKHLCDQLVILQKGKTLFEGDIASYQKFNPKPKGFLL